MTKPSVSPFPSPSPAESGPASLAHRGGLATRLRRLRPEPGLLERIGGQEKLERVVDRLYLRIADDPLLRPLFGDRVHGEHRMQKFFFVEWAGGEARYRHDGTGHGMFLLHYRFGLDRERISRWLQHLVTAMRLEGLKPPVVREMAQILGPMAHGLRHGDGPPLPPDCRRLSHAEWCSKLDEDPSFFAVHRGEGRRLLFRAAEQGDGERIALLAQAGLSVDEPLMRGDLMLTPWCVASASGHDECAELLLRLGARVDVFSLAYLGRVVELEALLDAEPELVNAEDPAMDLRGITPLHHAIGGGSAAAARLLFERGAEPGPDYARLLRVAADAGWTDVVSAFLADGRSARDVGPGEWVLHGDVAEQLAAAGADVNHPPGAWLHFCTARFGRADDGVLVARLLELGADTTARDHAAGPLHLAAAAGHVNILTALLDAGLDVDTPDEAGETPLAHVAWAVRSADRPATARLLLERGARLGRTGRQGVTVEQRLVQSKRRDRDALLALLHRFGKESPG